MSTIKPSADAVIDQVVREVLARLRPAPQEAAAAVLRLAAPLVAVDDVAGKLAGVRQLVVARETVVTPAVRDMLREAQVELVREASAASAAGQGLPLLLAVAELSYDVRPLEQMLARQGVAAVAAATSDLASAAARAGARAAANGRAVVLSARPLVAACLANRTRGVRCAAARDHAAAVEALSGLAANVLAMDPRPLGLAQLARMVRMFAAQPAGPVPDELAS
jgi:hypothetical protein